MISRDDIVRLASLARMKLTPDEVGRACTDLDAILAYVRELDAVQVDDTVTLRGPRGEAREDKFSPTVSGEDARQAFPKQRDGYCAAPRVFREAPST